MLQSSTCSLNHRIGFAADQFAGMAIQILYYFSAPKRASLHHQMKHFANELYKSDEHAQREPNCRIAPPPSTTVNDSMQITEVIRQDHATSSFRFEKTPHPATEQTPNYCIVSYYLSVQRSHTQWLYLLRSVIALPNQ